MGHVIYHGPPPGYCATCYGAAAKAGRPVRATTVYPHEICSLCESRIRNGLVHYRPSNGSEGMMFEERCESCRYCSQHKEGYQTCAFLILDKLMASAWENHDSPKTWWSPEDLKTRCDDGSPICPAECVRYVSRDDPNGAMFDPPPKDCEGQLFFSDLNIPVERVPSPAMEQAR